MKVLDPTSKKYLAYLYNKGYANIPNLSYGEVRQLFSSSPSSILKNIFSIDYNGHVIKCHHYSPPQTDTRRVILFFHGGGYVIRNSAQIDKICERLAVITQSLIVSIDYSLSPEKKFPYALEECTYIIDFLMNNNQWIDKKIDHFYLCGESSGGNLTTAILLNKKQLLKGLILITPSLDYFNKYASKEFYHEGHLLDSQVRNWFTKQYLTTDDERKDPLVSPVLSNNLNLLPSTLIMNAYFDPLRDEAEEFFKRAKLAKVDIELSTFDTIHGFLGMDIMPFSKSAYDKICHFINRIESISQ